MAKRGLHKSVIQGVRPVGTGGGRASAATYCEKAGGIVAVESPAETVVMHWADLDPRVLTVSAQPFGLDLLDGSLFTNKFDVEGRRKRYVGRKGQRIYTPDGQLVLSDREVLIGEVKSEEFQGNAEYQQMLDRVRLLLAERGLHFRRFVIPADRRDPIWINASLLRVARLRADLLPGGEILERLIAFSRGARRTLRQVLEHVGLPLAMGPVLLVHGVLSADLGAQAISGSMAVEAADGCLDHLSVMPFHV
jgi:hypothetical protein